MVDGPPGDPQDTPPPNTTPLPQRTFFSSTSANNFLERLRAVLDEQHAQTLQATLQAQEAFTHQINAPIVVLTANIERLLNAMHPPASRRSPALTPDRETLLTAPQRPTPLLTEASEDIPVHPYHSPHPPPRPPPQTATRPLPVWEMTAFTTTTGEPQTNYGGGRPPGVKIPKFYGEDSENVLARLHVVDHYFLLNHTPDPEKVTTVYFSLKGGARSFAHVLVIN